MFWIVESTGKPVGPAVMGYGPLASGAGRFSETVSSNKLWIGYAAFTWTSTDYLKIVLYATK